MQKEDEPSLLERLDLQLDQLDYSYVKDCNDKRTLERIIKVLRSGQEGYYPDFLSFTEDRLAQLHPESRMLITDKPAKRVRDLSSKEIKSLDDDLKRWTLNVKEEEEELLRYDVIRAPLPPVRNAKARHLMPQTTPQEPDQRTHMPTEERESLLSLGQKHLMGGDFLQASLQFQKVLECDPLNTVALKGMATIRERPKDDTGNNHYGRRSGKGVLIQEIL